MSIDTVAVWHQVAKNRDLAGLDSLLHRDVVFHSPVVHSPQVGKSITTQYLAAAFQVFFNDSFVYVREVHGQGHAMLEFNVEIQGIVVNGVDMISWDQDGLITDFKVMVRPLKGVNLIHQNMGTMLQAQSS
jgi:hypothetical protein